VVVLLEIEIYKLSCDAFEFKLICTRLCYVSRSFINDLMSGEILFQVSLLLKPVSRGDLERKLEPISLVAT